MLHLKLIDKDNTVLIDDDIKHIDACRSHTIFYTDDRIIPESDFHIIEEMEFINCIAGKIVIFYKSGARLELTKN